MRVRVRVRVQALGLGFGFKIRLGFRVWEIRVWGLNRFRVQGSGFWGLGFGVEKQGSGFGIFG